MKHITLLLGAMVGVTLTAQAQSHAEHGTNTMPGMSMPMPVEPATASSTEANTLPHLVNDWEAPINDRMKFNYVLIDRLEFATGTGPDALQLDAQGWYGGDINKFWWRAEGTQTLQGSATGSGEGEIQALYSRLVAKYWDFQTGVRYDTTWGSGPTRDRAFAVIGFTGLAPYWFEIEPSLYLSQDGDISARLSATYDALLTQRLILQPRLDANLALQDVPRFGVGRGFNDIELGLRLRYEFRREFAPYIGVTWGRKLGGSADYARQSGDPVNITRFVLGARMWW